MGRLIDKDSLLKELQVKLYIAEMNANFSGNRVINVDWDDAICAIKQAETVEAIPIEWIAKWMGKHQGLEYDEWNLAIGTMVKDWEKENETNQ